MQIAQEVATASRVGLEVFAQILVLSGVLQCRLKLQDAYSCVLFIDSDCSWRS